jgi:hypothetical protein
MNDAGAYVLLSIRKCCLSKGARCLYEGFGMAVIKYRTAGFKIADPG